MDNTITITKAGTGGGTVTPSSGTITWTSSVGTVSYADSGLTVYYYVVPGLGSSFMNWSGCSSVSDNGTCTVDTSDNKSLTVNFGGSSVYSLTVVKSGLGAGTVVPSTSSLTWSGNTGTASYNSNQTVYLYQTADSMSKFSYWLGCDSVSDNGTCTVSMKSNVVVKARFSGYYNVNYIFPYLHTSDSSVVYCVVSNFSTDNATGDGFTVMSTAKRIPSQVPYELPVGFTIKNTRSAMLAFNNQTVAIKNDNLTVFTITDNNSVSIANDTCTGCSYGARISWTSKLASMTSGINCLNVLMSCFQGTTQPKRNLVGYACVDDSTSGPGGKSNLIGY
ncbi:MAG: hypothetical protein HQL01_12155 [Nitrospirae bacterium]|nr:hypothetical protein [Nitrospirota bacterium]